MPSLLGNLGMIPTFQLNLDQWVRGANLTCGRYAHRAVACQGSAFVVGGTDSKGELGFEHDNETMNLKFRR